MIYPISLVLVLILAFSESAAASALNVNESRLSRELSCDESLARYRGTEARFGWPVAYDEAEAEYGAPAM